MGNNSQVTKRIVVEGWQDPRKPKLVSLVDVLRRHTSLDLHDAKRILDTVSETGQMIVEFTTIEQSAEFIAEAESIGALVRIVND